jgi:hypothetical protein
MSSVSPVIHFESDEAKKTAAGAMFVAVPYERPRFLGRRDAVFLFQVHVGFPFVVSICFL